jgi:hypothetical protein
MMQGMRSRRFFHKKSSKNCPPGGVTILGRDAIERFGVRALEGVDAKMDGVIVTVVHDEFRGMGLSGVGGFLGAGVVASG